MSKNKIKRSRRKRLLKIKRWQKDEHAKIIDSPIYKYFREKLIDIPEGSFITTEPSKYPISHFYSTEPNKNIDIFELDCAHS